jgi:glycosyltransferase involved in cell wall biosynthesis
MTSSAGRAGRGVAIYYVPEGYSTRGEQLMGINVASEGVLRGLALYGNLDRLDAVSENSGAGKVFIETIAAWAPDLAADWISTGEIERVGPLGTLLLPGPGLGDYAWMRRRVGEAAFSLCGVTHTTATPRALDALTDLLVAPVEPWDAVICTSRAVGAMVGAVLEAQSRYLSDRFGRSIGPRPQLPVIPLGVDSASFAPEQGEREAARDALGLADGDVALLFAGRLDPVTKSHPIPLFLAVAMAQTRARGRLRLLMSGWFASQAAETFYREAAAMICPDVDILILDGRDPEARRQARVAADVFISPVDNVQETFGLTPVEAMAAGLPVIASDWNGYRETVRHGIDGLLVRAWAPPPGEGGDLARDYGANLIDYPAYVGSASQATAIDLSDLTDAIVALGDDPALRARMGAAGQKRAADFDWARIVPQYVALWAELAARRPLAGAMGGPAGSHPARPDPFAAFAGYPSNMIGREVRISPGLTAPGMIDVLLASPLIAFAAPTLPEPEVLASIVRRVEQCGATLGDLAGTFAGPDGERLGRGVGWLAKYGFVRLAS